MKDKKYGLLNKLLFVFVIALTILTSIALAWNLYLTLELRKVELVKENVESISPLMTKMNGEGNEKLVDSQHNEVRVLTVL